MGSPLDAVLFVYYKVPAAQQAALLPVVRQFQARLRSSWAGLEAELLQRPELSDGIATWMESYRSSAGLSAALVAAIAQAAADADLPVARHVETFVPLR